MNNEKKFIKLTPFKMQVLQSFPFIDADFDAITNYELLCKVVEYLNITVDNVNLLESDFKVLYDYVHDYFDNLDVQEEINNKLDEMAESGQLTDIIAQYLGLAGMLTFNTVADMKNATNLVNGSICQTLGFHEVNDGGKAIYKIRNVSNIDDINEINIFALYDTNLIAELVENKSINLKQLGCYGNDNNDDTIIFRYAVNNYNIVNVDSGIYKISENILISNNVTIKSENDGILHFTNGSENICPNQNYKVNLKNVKIISDNGIVYHINKESVKDTRIENNNIYSNSYSILVNANTDNGQDLFINNNTIDTASDGIEINTTNNTENKFKNININSNIIKVTRGSGSQSGFAIGIANGKNINIISNIIDGARNEGIHVEDYSEEINIHNNVINNCLSNGMRIYSITNNYKKSNISGNIINGDKSTNHCGIDLPVTTTTDGKDFIITNNYISNFDTGIRTFRNIFFDNNTIANCNIAFNSDCENIMGKTKLIDTPIIINYNKDRITTIEDVEINMTNNNFINIDNFITKSTNGILIFNRLKYSQYLPITSTSDSRKIKFLKLPTLFDGIIKISIETGGANKGKSISKVSYNATDGVVKTLIAQKNNGVFTSSDNIKAEDGYLCVTPYNPNQSSGGMTLEVELIGNLVIADTY